MLRLAKQVKTTNFCYAKSFKARGNLENSAIKYSFSASEPPKNNDPKANEKLSFIQKHFGVQNSFAKESYKNRWFMVLPAFLTHLSIGSPYGWSVLASTLIRENGFVISAASDWTLSQATFPLSLIFATQGLVAGLVGGWQIKNGTRASIALASLFFGGGFAIGSLGIYTGQLWLLYLGYGVLGGCGIGLAYTPPLQALIDWFPDKKGLASGLALAGFGSGALLFTPLIQRLMGYFSKMPEFLGPAGSVETYVEGGRLFAKTLGGAKEVVLANATDISKLPYTFAEGLYVVGSGSTGAAAALAVSGGIYFAIMLASSLMLKRPFPGFKPAGWNPASSKSVVGNVPLSNVMKTPQIYIMISTLFCLASGGIGVMAIAKSMMAEQFSTALPSVVTPAFSSKFVLILAAANMLGRFGWATFSDKLGRRTIFNMFTIGAIPLYASLPFFISWVSTNPSMVPLYGFIGSSFLIVSILGGTYSALPAYEADLFGGKYVGAIHGRVLLANTAASFAGPQILLQMRSRSERAAINDLISKIPESAFQEKFNIPVTEVEPLIKAKTITISKLMELVPPGTVDPTPFLYDSALYTLAGLAASAAVLHYCLKPVDPKHFEKVEELVKNSETKINPPK